MSKTLIHSGWLVTLADATQQGLDSLSKIQETGTLRPRLSAEEKALHERCMAMSARLTKRISIGLSATHSSAASQVLYLSTQVTIVGALAQPF